MSSFSTSPLLDFKLLARSKPTVIESKWNVYTSISYCRVDIKLLLDMFNSTMLMFFVLSSWIWILYAQQARLWIHLCTTFYLKKPYIRAFSHTTKFEKIGKMYNIFNLRQSFFCDFCLFNLRCKKWSWKKAKMRSSQKLLDIWQFIGSKAHHHLI